MVEKVVKSDIMRESKNKIYKYLVFASLLLVLMVVNVYADNSYLAYDTTVSCGPIFKIPSKVPEVISSLINAVQVIVPILLVIFGIIDLVKGVMAQKEDEIKKGQQTLIKRIIIGAIVFLVIMLVKILVNFVAQSTENRNNIVSCINCFISGDCVRSSGNGSPTPGGHGGINTRPTVDEM